jgi:hypothetical protein
LSKSTVSRIVHDVDWSLLHQYDCVGNGRDVLVTEEPVAFDNLLALAQGVL